MKSFYLFAILNLFILSVFSANTNVKFGKVSKSEFEINSFNGDTSYSAIILHDYGKAYYSYDQNNGGFRVNYLRHKRIKILKKEGYKYATESLSLYSNGKGKESVTNLKGFTYYLEDGKIIKTKLKSDSKFKEDKSENVNVIKFTMPEVKEGCIIEYEYNIVSDFNWSLKDWYFQDNVPTLYSECITSIPEYYNYKRFMQGYQVLDVSESGTEGGSFTVQSKTRTSNGGMSSTQTKFQTYTHNYTNNVNRWVMTNVPGFKPEPYMPAEHDYISKITFEIANTNFVRVQGEYKDYTQTWEAITDRMLENDRFGLQLNRRGLVKDEVNEITANSSDPKEKMIAIYNFVKSNVKWNGNYGYYTTTTLRQALNEANGNVADINMLLTLMLNEADIKAYPVLLSTRAHGKLNFDFPTQSQMNYVITCAIIDGEEYLLDATDLNRPYNILPRRCLNGRGKIIAEDKLSEWVELKNKDIYTKSINAVLAVSTDNTLDAQIRTSHKNLAAYYERDQIITDGEEKFIEDYQNKWSSWEFEDIEIENLGDTKGELKKKLKINITDHIEEAGDMIFFNPFLMERWEENPFKNDKREYPIDFVHPMRERFSITIQLPEGYAVDELPKPAVVKLPNNAAQFQYLLNNTGNSIQIICKLNLNKTMYIPDEYEYLKEFFTTVVSKQAEKIVLKKI